MQVTEDYHPPNPDYWEEIMPQFDLDLIVEEVSCNMIESEPENDVSQCDDKSCVEDYVGQLCASTLCSTSLHTVQLRPDEISDTSMITLLSMEQLTPLILRTCSSLMMRWSMMRNLFNC